MKIVLLKAGLIFAVYCIVVALAWAWCLGLQFDWWKLLVVGIVQAFANLIADGIFKAVRDKNKKEDSP